MEEISELQLFQSNQRIHLFIEFMKQYHMNPGSKISAYLCKNKTMFEDSLWKSKYIDNPKWNYNEKIINTKVSNIQNYHKSNTKAIIPLLTLGI